MAQLEKMMDDIKGMTVLELNELVKALEDEFGVSAAAAAPMMMAGAMPGAAGGEQAEEEAKDAQETEESQEPQEAQETKES